MKHIVIVGGGFAGLWGAMAAVRQLDDAGRAADVRLSLVSRDPYLTIRPRLHEAHPGEHMRVPLAGVLGSIGVEFVHATATGIDTDRRAVMVAGAGGATPSLSYDRLLLTAGSQLHRPDVPGLAEHGRSVDTFEDATALEAHLQGLGTEPDGPGRLTAVVVGAGFTGIEVAAEADEAPDQYRVDLPARHRRPARHPRRGGPRPAPQGEHVTLMPTEPIIVRNPDKLSPARAAGPACPEDA